MADTVLIGDAGGSKTDWRLVQDGKVKQFKTQGFNAFIHSAYDFKRQIAETIKIDELQAFHVYCAGAHTPAQKRHIADTLEELYGLKPAVESDLLGAARATCGKEPGYVGILGTGSNASYYNGETVQRVSASLGYILGDEGGGAYLGKQLLRGVYRERFSKSLIDSFQETFELPHDKAIANLYAAAAPNHYLSSFVPFIEKHKNDPLMYRMIEGVFRDFFNAFFFEPPTGATIHFVGSIAHIFSDILGAVAQEFAFHLGNIVASPIAGLVLYHTHE